MAYRITAGPIPWRYEEPSSVSDVTGTHTAFSLKFTLGTHVGAVDRIFTQTSLSLDLTTGTHSGSLGVNGAHSSKSLLITAGTHAFSVDSYGIQSSFQIELTAGTHVGSVDIIVEHTASSLKLTTGTHTGTVSSPSDITGTHSITGYYFHTGSHTCTRIIITRADRAGRNRWRVYGEGFFPEGINPTGTIAGYPFTVGGGVTDTYLEATQDNLTPSGSQTLILINSNQMVASIIVRVKGATRTMPAYYKEIPATIASGSQESSAVCVAGQNGLAVELPTFAGGLNTAAASVYLKGSEEESGTYRQIYCYSAASGYNLLEVPSGAGNYTVSLGPRAEYVPRFIKVCVTGTNATATAAGYASVVHMYI